MIDETFKDKYPLLLYVLTESVCYLEIRCIRSLTLEEKINVMYCINLRSTRTHYSSIKVIADTIEECFKNIEVALDTFKSV